MEVKKALNKDGAEKNIYNTAFLCCGDTRGNVIAQVILGNSNVTV